MEAVLQIVGAVAILAAYVAAQFRLLQQEHPVYLLLNLLGAGILAVIAYQERQWGFLLLEGVWTLISLRGVIQWSVRTRGRQRAHPPLSNDLTVQEIVRRGSRPERRHRLT